MGELHGLPWIDVFQAVWGIRSSNSDQITAWATTLKTWAELFEAESRSNGEMVDAVVAVSKRTKLPQFPTDHLQAIREELAKQDTAFARQREDARLADLTQPTRCRRCRDVGLITGLPHHQFVDGVQWQRPRHTQAATCDCPAGQTSRQRWMGMNKVLMTFQEYERINPHWRSQIQMRRLEVEAELTAHRQQHGDPAWMAIVEKLKARMTNAHG